MRVKVINPNTTQSMTAGIGQAARAAAAPGTEIIAVSPAGGPLSIEGHYDEAYAVPGLLGVEDDGFAYDADDYNDDLPWYDTRYGRPQLVVPYALDANDMRFLAVQGFNSGEQFYTYLKDSFDALYAEGRDTPRMMSVGLHCRIAGKPGRILALERFIKYASKKPGVWFARRIDIARHWARRHPPP